MFNLENGKNTGFKTSAVQKNGRAVRAELYGAINSGKIVNADMYNCRWVFEEAEKVRKNDAHNRKFGCIACGFIAFIAAFAMLGQIISGGLLNIAVFFPLGIIALMVFMIRYLKQDYDKQMEVFEAVCRAIDRRSLNVMNYKILNKQWYDGGDSANEYYFIMDGFIVEATGKLYNETSEGSVMTAAVIFANGAEYFYMIGVRPDTTAYAY